MRTRDAFVDLRPERQRAFAGLGHHRGAERPRVRQPELQQLSVLYRFRPIAEEAESGSGHVAELGELFAAAPLAQRADDTQVYGIRGRPREHRLHSRAVVYRWVGAGKSIHVAIPTPTRGGLKTGYRFACFEAGLAHAGREVYPARAYAKPRYRDTFSRVISLPIADADAVCAEEKVERTSVVRTFPIVHTDPTYQPALHAGKVADARLRYGSFSPHRCRFSRWRNPRGLPEAKHHRLDK